MKILPKVFFWEQGVTNDIKEEKICLSIPKGFLEDFLMFFVRSRAKNVKNISFPRIYVCDKSGTHFLLKFSAFNNLDPSKASIILKRMARKFARRKKIDFMIFEKIVSFKKAAQSQPALPSKKG